MKHLNWILAATTLSIFTVGQELPQPSPKAVVQQRVGLTDITIDYSRPSARGRKIFGELVPFNQIWRTGANRITLISLSTEVIVEGQKLPAGKYGLLTIPREDRWTVIFNSDTTLWGSDGYDQKKDVLRVDVVPNVFEGDIIETFTISVDALRENGATIVLAWENVKVPVNIDVEVDKMAMANIERAVKENHRDWRVFRNSAQYFLTKNIQIDRALEYINRSIELNPDNWYSHYLKGEILARKGNFAEAVNAGNTALKMGNEQAKAAGRPFGYADMIQNSLKDWREKAGINTKTGKKKK
ncbi:MAG: DUF2911 domain-containing protein [Thermaurantimonas sp.]|uniref:DUF2911 domain-containing protein n=1 Tax=Thermaurantimonas sp. TaxID=2681568 RepID=UPI00391C1256